MSNYKKLGRNIVIMTIGNFGSKVLSFLFVPLYTAILTTAEYGISDLITTTVSLCFPFFTLIISEPLLQFSLKNETDISKIWIAGLNVWVMGTIGMLACSPIIFFTPLKDYYFFVIGYYIVYSMYNCLSYFIRGLNKVFIFSLAGIVNTFFMIALNIIFLIVIKIGILGYLLSNIISCFVACVFIIVFGGIYKYGFNILRVDKGLRRKMLSYSIPMIPNSISWWIANASDRYILTMFSGLTAAGIYAVAYKIPTIISTFSGIFNSAWRLSANDDFGSESSCRFYEDIYSKLTVLLVCLSSALIVINKPLAHFLFSNDFYTAWKCVPFLLLSATFHSYADFFGTIYTTSFKTKYLFYSTVLGAATNIVLNLILIPFWSGQGAAVATLLSYIVVWLFRVFHSRKILALKYNIKRDLFCYIVVFIQLIISELEMNSEIIISFACMLLVFTAMRKEIYSVLKMFIKRR